MQIAIYSYQNLELKSKYINPKIGIYLLRNTVTLHFHNLQKFNISECHQINKIFRLHICILHARLMLNITRYHALNFIDIINFANHSKSNNGLYQCLLNINKFIF